MWGLVCPSVETEEAGSGSIFFLGSPTYRQDSGGSTERAEMRPCMFFDD